MGTYSALPALCAGNSRVTGQFPWQRPMTRSFDLFHWSAPKTNGWVNNRDAGDFWRHHAHYDVRVIICLYMIYIFDCVQVTYIFRFITITSWWARWRLKSPAFRLFTQRFLQAKIKKSKLRVTGLYEGNSPVTGEIPSQRASNAENASIWWRHHVYSVTAYRRGTVWPNDLPCLIWKINKMVLVFLAEWFPSPLPHLSNEK